MRSLKIIKDGTYTLVHIPLHLYSSLLQPILRVLLHQTRGLTPPSASSSALDPLDFGLEGLTPDGQHGFLNISITPIEVSIVCHSSWAKNVFEPAIAALPKEAARSVQVSRSQYTVLSVISAGLDAAGRVMDLTAPLALAGIPIFFISTYYSDFILVPEKERGKVVSALMDKGFELSENQSAFVNSSAYGGGSSNDSRSSGSTTPPRTPPPSSVAELQCRAFDLLKKRNITAQVFPDLELAQCSGREISPMTDVVYNSHRRTGSRHGGAGGKEEDTPNWVDSVDAKLYTCIVSALVSQPKFMSLTLAQEDPPSLLIDKALLPIFGDSLVGDTEGRQIPIFLDLASLPTEVTGIVCGVAGRLFQEMRLTGSSELSYLSTARAGAVILPDEQSTRALDILQPLLSKD